MADVPASTLVTARLGRRPGVLDVAVNVLALNRLRLPIWHRPIPRTRQSTHPRHPMTGG